MSNLPEIWNTVVLGWDVWKWLTLAPFVLASARILWKVGRWILPKEKDGERPRNRETQHADRESAREHKNKVSFKHIEEKVHGVAPESKVKLTRAQKRHQKDLIKADKAFREAIRHPKARFLVVNAGRALEEGGRDETQPGELLTLLDRTRTYRKGDLVVDTFHKLAFSCLGHGRWLAVDWGTGRFQVGKGVTYVPHHGSGRHPHHVRKIFDITDGGFAPKPKRGDLQADIACGTTRIWNGHYWWTPQTPSEFMEIRPSDRSHPDLIQQFVRDEWKVVRLTNSIEKAKVEAARDSRTKGKARDRAMPKLVEPRLKPETMDEVSVRVNQSLKDTAKAFGTMGATVEETAKALDTLRRA